MLGAGGLALGLAVVGRAEVIQQEGPEELNGTFATTDDVTGKGRLEKL